MREFYVPNLFVSKNIFYLCDLLGIKDSLRMMNDHLVELKDFLFLGVFSQSFQTIKGIPAPRLARAEVTKQKTRLDIMAQVIDVMIKMWKSAGIIHADFSEFNILYFQRQIWVWFLHVICKNSNIHELWVKHNRNKTFLRSLMYLKLSHVIIHLLWIFCSEIVDQLIAFLLNNGV